MVSLTADEMKKQLILGRKQTMSISEVSQFTVLSNFLWMYLTTKKYSADDISFLLALSDHTECHGLESNAGQS